MPSAALIGIDTNTDGNLDCLPDTSMVMSGPVSVNRSAPLDDSANFPGTRPVDLHLDVIDTEIVAMNLVGGGMTLIAGSGSGQGGVLGQSLGAIAEQAGDNAIADSFFDVMFEVHLGGGIYAYNQAALRIDSVIDCVPPNATYIHPVGCIALYDAAVGGNHIANLVTADHDTYPLPEACCFPDGTCAEETPGSCKQQGGTPQGEGTACAGTIEACCLPDGTCVSVDPTCCAGMGGEAKGSGSTCAGDLDGDGLDDTCYESDCADCGPGAHWVDTCPAGVDQMPSSALIGIDTDLDVDCTADISMVMSGPATIDRSAALDDSANYPGSAVIDGHLDAIDTEMKYLKLTGGGGVVMLAGSGQGQGGVLSATLGTIVEQAGDNTLGDSFFDVYVEVDMGGGVYYYNQAPLRVDSVIDCIPPDAAYIHPVGCIPLYDAVTGGTHVANLATADHDTYPRPEACCMPDGTCTEEIPANCKEQGGTPQGKDEHCSQTTEACCLPDGSCMDVDPLCCDDMGGVPSPTGASACQGDSNGDGIDDACQEVCEPTPDGLGCEPVTCPDPAVEQCVPIVVRRNVPQVWFPPAGIDDFPGTTGYVQIDGPGGLEVYTIGGEPNITKVTRGDSYDVVPGLLRRVDTEITQMELVAGGGGGGAIAVHLSQAQPSTGYVNSALSDSTDFPADSFFDVYVTIDVEDVPGAEGLYNALPIPLQALGLTNLPPYGSSFETPGGWQGVELLDANGDPSGYWIIQVVHVNPDPRPEWEVSQCECMDPDYCHINFVPGQEPTTCAGNCPPGEQCVMEAHDTNGDGIDDLYERHCEPDPTPVCPPDSLFSQPVHGPDDATDAVLSDAEYLTGRTAYENFWGLQESICDVHWWGLELNRPGGEWTECVRDVNTFKIKFYHDNAGSPGAEACSYTVTAQKTDTGLKYEGNAFTLYEYSAVLTPCCVLTSGWVSIQGFGDPDCWFFWMSSGVGDGQSRWWNGSSLTQRDHDLSLCLTPGPPSLVGWRSVRTHAAPVGLRPIPLDPNASGGAVVTETRGPLPGENGGIRRVEVDCDHDVSTMLIGLAQAEDLTHGGMIPTSNQYTINAGQTLVIEFTPGLPDETCYRIDLNGVIAGLVGDTDCLVRGLVGDVNGDQSTNNTDKSWIASLNGHPVLPGNIRFDLNLDGSVNNTDKSLVASRNGRSGSCP